MLKRNTTAFRIFSRYALTNILILALPLLLSTVYYLISLNAIRTSVNTITESQLSKSMLRIDKLFEDIDSMAAQLSNDYEINYYLSTSGPFDGIGFYNIKRISGKLLPFILRNELLSHSMLYMANNGHLAWESGFSEYTSFYGTLFSVQGFTAEEWKNSVLKAPENIVFFPFQSVRMNQQLYESHVYRYHIGFGDYFLGTVIGIIDRNNLDRLLAELPARYGGWVYIKSPDGRILSSTNSDLEQVATLDRTAAGSGTLLFGEKAFRLYRMTSSYNGWEYVAVLNETNVFSGVRIVRNIAFLLLGSALVIGLCASALAAFANSRPLRRLFTLVPGSEEESDNRRRSIYDLVEQAIVLMTDSNRQLEHEVRSAARITRTYFFQNLLRGSYRTRKEFSEDKARFGIVFSEKPYAVILCRLSPIHAVRESDSLSDFRDALLAAAGERIDPDDFVVPVSFDDIAVIKCIHDDTRFRENITSFIKAIQADIRVNFKPEFSFGIGMPAADPFLLIISCNQAATAISFMTSNHNSSFLFYDEVPSSKDSYFYPLDVEENIMKAVRSSNEDLLDSLIRILGTENFNTRSLSNADTRNLFIALQGTALRLLSDVQSGSEAIRARLVEWTGQNPSPEGLDGFTGILHALAEAYNHGKKSHNARLIESIDTYILENYSRSDLGLTVIAEKLRRSENYLSNFYKEQTGECLSAMIQRVRFEKAIQLMHETHETIDRIAVLCGYLNTGSFRRAFKRKSGMSPSEYKMKMNT